MRGETFPFDAVTLRSGPFTVIAAPALGGGLAGFASEQEQGRVDWLRPSDPELLERQGPEGLALFPLVPYSNRIRGDVFRFGQRTVRQPKALHGHGWKHPWTIVEQGPDRLTIAYRHTPDDWPWPYLARQDYLLHAGGLDIAIAIENESDEPMPCGLGVHPYFPRTPKARITASVSAMWRNDAGLLPVALEPPPRGADPNAGVTPAETPLDNVFTGWPGRAKIVWPETRRALDLTAAAPFSFLVLFSPPGESYFCAEPASNCTDAFNLAAAGRADTGMLVLEPGARAEGRLRLAPRVM
jgi:aldose 1-epimerase